MRTRTILTVILATMAIVSTSAQNKIVKKDYNLSSFSSITASGGWDIIISQGDKQSIITEVSENIADRVSLEVKNGTLHIGNKPTRRSFSIMNVRNTTQKAYITVTDLSQITSSGGVDIYFKTPINTNNFKLNMSGGSDLEDLTLSCNQFVANLSGGSDAEVRFAKVQSIKIDASGGSDANISGASAQTTTLNASGGSDINISDISSQQVTIDASGGSDIDIKGQTQQLTVTASGGSDISASGLTAQSCKANFAGAADGDIRVIDYLDISVSGSASVTCYGNPKEVKKNIAKTGSLSLK